MAQTLTICEQRFLETVPGILKRIAQELAIANELEAYRLRSERRQPDDAAAIDDIMQRGHA